MRRKYSFPYPLTQASNVKALIANARLTFKNEKSGSLLFTKNQIW